MGKQDSGGEDDEHDQQRAAAPQSQLSPGQDVPHRGGGANILLRPRSFRGGVVSLELSAASRAWKVTPERLACSTPVATWD